MVACISSNHISVGVVPPRGRRTVRGWLDCPPRNRVEASLRPNGATALWSRRIADDRARGNEFADTGCMDGGGNYPTSCWTIALGSNLVRLTKLKETEGVPDFVVFRMLRNSRHAKTDGIVGGVVEVRLRSQATLFAVRAKDAPQGLRGWLKNASENDRGRRPFRGGLPLLIVWLCGLMERLLAAAALLAPDEYVAAPLRGF
jgi:hypothetical protein